MTSYETIINAIKNDATYKQVLADSFGGIIYNTANRDKYDSTKIFSLWNELTEAQKAASGGIMRGAMSFLQGR